MIDSLPIANSFSGLIGKKSQWDSECERDLCDNASRALPCKSLSPSGVTPSMYALHSTIAASRLLSLPTEPCPVGVTRSAGNSGANPQTPCSAEWPLVALAQRHIHYTSTRIRSKEDGVHSLR